MNYQTTPSTKPFHLPIPQYFGIGISAQLGEKLKGLGCTKVLVVCDKGVEAAGIPARLIEHITAAGIESIVYNGVLPDPPDTSIGEAVDMALAGKVDGIVAIGGGSSIDTAKAVSLLSTNEGPINRFFDPGTLRKPGLPLVAVPTTAGTGSEASGGGVITETATQAKRIFITGATMALIDPELTVDVPSKVTAACGFDVLAHCLDAIFSTQAGPLCKLIAYQGVRLFHSSILTVCENGKNLQARSDMAQASNIGGICISTGGINLCHALAHSLGAKFHISHGAACAMMAPACLESMSKACPEEVWELANIFGVERAAGDTASALGHKIALALVVLAKKAGVPSLKDCVPQLEDLYQIIPSALQETASISRSSIPVDENVCKWVLDTAYRYQPMNDTAV